MMKTQQMLPHRQKGIALVIFAIALVVIIGIAGMALDLGRVMLDDARIQNALDACALSGAKVLMDTTGSDGVRMEAAETAAKATVSLEQSEHNKKLGGLSSDDVDVKFSDALDSDFDFYEAYAGSNPPRYVRCAVETYSITTKLASILGITELGLNVRAVAGPIFIDNCTPAPLLVCGDPTDDCEKDDEDGTCHGFNVFKTDDENYEEEKCYLKSCPGNPHCDGLANGEICGFQKDSPTGGGNQVADVSAGNFQLLDFTCASGKKGVPCIKEAFTQGGAVIEGGCPTDGSNVTTQTGNPQSIIDAYNVIFDGLPDGDSNSAEPLYYSDYSDDIPTKGNGRRVLGVVIGDCENEIIKSGKTEVPVLTVGCFFATEPAIKGGSDSVIWGQFVDRCAGTGPITRDPDVFDTYKIVLYKDYEGPDS